MWLRRLNAVIDDLDITGDRERDARITQLHEVYTAAAKVIRVIDQSKVKSRIADETRAAAREVVFSVLTAGRRSGLAAACPHLTA
ncbi:hypothetical protein GCM10010324_58200 [Streptomyces hiroshimensis]|uniref:Uncharacterized protein n=1 Tax=Streptomyces hiroshimensis TaxID=66424 RepID=A0ABQ2Z7B5_9ACTN|nr:hypothetical protein GCM10010324_58200 [Streptomyces hiroshimensis]